MKNAIKYPLYVKKQNDATRLLAGNNPDKLALTEMKTMDTGVFLNYLVDKLKRKEKRPCHPFKTALLTLLFHILAGPVLSSQNPVPKPTSLRGNGLAFTQNNGQIVDMSHQLRPDILYMGSGSGMDIYIRKTGISYVQNNLSDFPNEHKRFSEKKESPDFLANQQVTINRLDMDFVNCNSAIQEISSDSIEGYCNFYYGHCPNGILNVKSYNELQIRNIYRNIDVKYYGGKESGLKYDIIINPGADPNDIILKYSGAEKLSLNHGHLTVQTVRGQLGEYLPKVYQIINGVTIDVKAEYVLREVSGSANLNPYEVTFKLGHFNHDYPLTIDPWITYYGGSGNDFATSVTTDANGDIIYTGITTSVDFPVNPGAFQSTKAAGGFQNGCIVKFTSAGARVFATYIGGNDADVLAGVSTDAANTIFATGMTYSDNFPTMNPGGGAYMQGYPGFEAIIIVKFTSAGTLLWSTFYGGSSGLHSQSGQDVTVDGTGNLFVTGCSEYTDFPVLAPFQATNHASAGNSNAIILKFDNNGVRQWSTYYGGTSGGSEIGTGITCDAAGDIYFCGTTGNENDFPLLSAYQVSRGGVFIAKLLGSTGFPIWSTYYGADQDDQCDAIALDCNGNVFISGVTQSATGMTTPGAFQPINPQAGQGYPTVFVAKFNNAGIRQWGTYLAGAAIVNGTGESSGIVCDKNNNVIVAGDTYDAGFPVTSCAFQSAFYGHEDNFITSFDNNGNLIYSSLFGLGVNSSSPDNETYSGFGGCIAVGGCFVYLAASSVCSYPVTPGAYQTTCGGNADFSLPQLNISICNSTNKALAFTSSSSSCCSGNSVNYTSTFLTCNSAGTTYNWSFPGGTPSSSALQNPTGILYNTPGTYAVKLIITTPCTTDSLIKPDYINVIPCSFLSVTAAANPICSEGCATVTATGSSGTAPYAYSWNTGATGATITPCGLLTSTGYTVTVTDAGANTATTAVTVTVNPSVSVSTSPTAVGCNGSSNGSITANPSAGTGLYTYSWSNNQATQTDVGLPQGTYTLTVTDGKGCTVVTTAAITQPPAISASINSVPASCGSSNGSAGVSATGGSGTLSYLWSTSATAQTISGQAAGSYTVTVTDGNGCTESTVAAISNDPAPAINSLTAPELSCNGANSGTVTVTASGGSGALTYSWSNGSSGVTAISGLSSGTFVVSVTDQLGCRAVASAVLSQPAALTAGTGTVSSTCGNANGRVNVSPEGGTPGYTCLWSNAASGRTAGNLLAGSYTVTVTDANGCSVTRSLAVTNISGPSAYIDKFTNVACNGSASGMAQAIATGGSGALQYSWSNTVKGSDNPGIVAGTYSVTVTDGNGCTSTDSVNITQSPALIAIASSTTPLCSGSGSVNVNASGGSPGYNYFWSVGSTAQSVSGLLNNTYSVTVTDSKGCSAISTTAVTAPSPITINTSSTRAGCGLSNAGASALASGGSGALSYLWSNTASGPALSGIPAGTYTVTVTDGNGCTQSALVFVGNNPGPAITNLQVTDPLCNGALTGSALVNASGGSGALSYTWSNGFTSLSGQVVSSLAGGTYLIRVTDTSGCQADSSVTITQPAPLELSTTKVSATCGQANGSAGVNVLGGSGLYNFSWNTSSGIISGQILSGLTGGIYSVTVTDANNCSATASVSIGNSSPPVINSLTQTPVSCYGGNNGSATVSASGGTGTLTYSWGSGVTGTTTISSLMVGFQVVLVTDSLGCRIDQVVNITQPPAINPFAVADHSSLCGKSDASASASASGGVGTYSYQWSSGTNLFTGQTVSGMGPGIYTLTVSDANACTLTTTLTITTTAGPTISSLTPVNPACSGETGLATVSATGAGSLAYRWSNAQTGSTDTILVSGTYTVTITDSNGCSTTQSATISVPSTVIAQASQLTSASCGQSNGNAAVTASGGTGSNYAYSWSGSSTAFSGQGSDSLKGLISGSYSVTVTDQNGCTGTSSVTIQNSSGPSVSIQDTSNTCQGKTDGSITIQATGTALTYLWSSGQRSQNLSKLSSGTYSVTVTDGTGCTATTSATIRLLSGPTVNVSRDTLIMAGASTQLWAGGGISYLWTPSGSLTNAAIFNPIAEPIQTTTYTVIVTGPNECQASDSVTVTVRQIDCDSVTIFVPTAFSPNGDGMNDVLYVRPPACVTQMEFQIYDRWGELLFSTSNPKTGWDGSYKGQPMNMGVFVYYLTATIFNGRTISKKGNVTLMK